MVGAVGWWRVTHPLTPPHAHPLRAHAGARPYHRAHERGVKIIGATAHYATSGGWVGGWRVCCPIRTLAPPEYPPPTPAPAHPPPDLDCGPIIDQDVRRVTHRDSVQDMVRKARSRVCARVRACVVGPSAHQPPHPPTPHPPTHEQGRDLERLVLARAVRWHVEDRVIVHNNKTVVFED